MFSVLKGMKALTEQSVEAGIPSGLAVDLREYFRDEGRYRAWRKLLGHAAAKRGNEEIADSFLVFIKNLKEGKPLVVSGLASAPTEHVAPVAEQEPSHIPASLTEETLPAIQQAE